MLQERSRLVVSIASLTGERFVFMFITKTEEIRQTLSKFNTIITTIYPKNRFDIVLQITTPNNTKCLFLGCP